MRMAEKIQEQSLAQKFGFFEIFLLNRILTLRTKSTN